MLKHRVKASFDKHVFLREPRNQLPLEEERAEEDLRVFSKWLLVVPLVLFLILSFGQLALLIKSEIRVSSSQSKLSAEYSPWEFFSVRRLRDGLIDEIRNDSNGHTNSKAAFEKPIYVTGQDWMNVRTLTNIEVQENLDLLSPTPTSSHFSPTPE